MKKTYTKKQIALAYQAGLKQAKKLTDQWNYEYWTKYFNYKQFPIDEWMKKGQLKQASIEGDTFTLKLNTDVLLES